MFCCKKTGWQNLEKSPSPLWTGLYPCLLRNLFFVECQLTASCGCITTSWSFWWSALLNAPADAGWPARCLVSQTKYHGTWEMVAGRWPRGGDASPRTLAARLKLKPPPPILFGEGGDHQGHDARLAALEKRWSWQSGGRGKRRSGPAVKVVKTCQT